MVRVLYDREKPSAEWHVPVRVMTRSVETVEPYIAMIDTGSSITVIPRAYVAKHGPVLAGKRLVSAFGSGSAVSHSAYKIKIILGELDVWVDVITHHEEVVILGRDVLRHLVIIACNDRPCAAVILPKASRPDERQWSWAALACSDRGCARVI